MSKMSEQMAAIQKKKDVPVEKPKHPMIQLIEDNQGSFDAILGKMIPVERFIKLATTAINLNPKLLLCEVSSVFGALIEAARFQLEVNSPLGQAYIIPYDTSVNVNGQWKKRKLAVFQLGYQGAIEIFMRHPDAKVVRAHKVYAKDEFEYELGLVPKLIHKPSREDDLGEPIMYYAVAELKSGGSSFSVMSHNQVLAHAKKYSKGYDKKTGQFKSSWKDDFEAMALKTVVVQALKYLPKRIDTYTDEEVVHHVDPEDLKNPGFNPELMQNEIHELEDHSSEVVDEQEETEPTVSKKEQVDDTKEPELNI